MPEMTSQSPDAGAQGAGRSGPAPEVRGAGADPARRLLQYVRVLYKRRWIAGTSFLIVFVTTCLYTFTVTPIYEARVRLLIDKESQNVVSFKEAVEQNQGTPDYYETQYKLLGSRGLARRTIEALDLWERPQPAARPSVAARFVALVAAPVIRLRQFLAPPRRNVPAAGETARESAIIDQFLAGVTVEPIRYTRLVDVLYQSPDPAFAAAAANALANAYIRQNLETKFSLSKDASDWLSAQLAEQRQRVEASERALQQYREHTDSISLEDKENIVVQKLADLSAAVTRAKLERIQKETAYEQVKGVRGDPAALEAIPAIQSSPLIQQQRAELADLQRQRAQLSQKLGPNHPDMVKLSIAIRTAQGKIQQEVAKVVQAMRNDYLAAVEQERSLAAALDQQKRNAIELNRNAAEYGVLQRDAATNRQVYDSLLQRTKETGISSELKTNNIRIVDPAEPPPRPIAPSTPLNVLGALIRGLVVALAMTGLFEYLDSRLKHPDEIKQYLGLPFLGMVPLAGQDGSDPVISSGARGAFFESFRAIRTNVVFSAPDADRRTIVVTSTGPGEGKTIVAGNLAISLAQAGQRVLLIDADMRKPRVHDLFGKPQAPGLSNVIVGTAKASESLRQSSVAGLWVLPAGLHPPNPPELLGSDRFNQFLASVAQHFQYIVIDTPPVMAVTDASVVAHVATAIIYVVGAEMTARQAARQAIEQLQHARAKVIGAVLNRVDLQHYPYYYSGYYRRAYTDHYEQEASA